MRHHTGSFGEALDTHENRFKATSQGFELNMEKLNKWKMALRGTANLSGYHFKHGYPSFNLVVSNMAIISNMAN